VLADGEEVFDIVPCLKQYAQYAAGFGAGCCGDAFGHFALKHAGAACDTILIVEHTEENLRGYIIRIVADHAERAGGRREEGVEVHFEEVAGDDCSG
jgi:hypothetical protein